MTEGARVVIVGYRPHEGAGKREALRRLVATHLATLRAQQLVTDRAPVVMEGKDGTIVEVFEWASAAAIEAAHGNPVVQAMWKAFAEVCDNVPLAQIPEAGDVFSEFTPLSLPDPAPVAAAPARPSRPPLTPPDPPRRPTNEFGDPRDTLYAGGTPRFDETGGLGGIEPPGKRRR